MDVRAIKEQFLAPDQARFLAEFDYTLEEALKGLDAETLANFCQTGVNRQWLIQVVAEIPAIAKVQLRRFHELALRPQPFEEQQQLKFEEHHGIDTGPANRSILVGHPVAHEA